MGFKLVSVKIDKKSTQKQKVTAGVSCTSFAEK